MPAPLAGLLLFLQINDHKVLVPPIYENDGWARPLPQKICRRHMLVHADLFASLQLL